MPEPVKSSIDHEYVVIGNSPRKVSFILEWANTNYSGVPRFFSFLEILKRQWRELAEENYPDNLEPDRRNFLKCIDPVPELLIVSGEIISIGLAEEIRQRCAPDFTPAIHVGEGLEYYALKNLGAELAGGNILCFIDSDIYPDDGWLLHLLGTFAVPHIRAVAGQPYIAPIDLFSSAFALGWTYELADTSGRLFHSAKFYSNNIAIEAELFNRVKFPTLQRRTRGAGSLLGKQLTELGYPVWQNRKALVDHPAPSSWKHLVIRALAHGRDMYMKTSEERNWQGLFYSQEIAASRLMRGIRNTFQNWRAVGLRPLEVIPATLIIFAYYALFSLGGLLTHVSPQVMGRHFRL